MPIGVDEAGRGPVLGSMFVAAVSAPRSVIPDPVDDSKRLSPERRRELAGRLDGDNRVAIGIVEVLPERIDAEHLTDLTVEAHAEALERIADSGAVAVCDAADVDEDRFARRVAEALDEDVEVAAAHQADETDSLVGAASIVAKEAREAHVASLASEFGEVGSGYPSDPTTRAFLREYVRDRGDLPPCARRSWRTSRDVIAAFDQSRLDEF